MHSSLYVKQRKLVPRFRRKNQNTNLVDIDDQEAQALIEKDLESNFKWTSDITENLKYQYDDVNYQESNQQISINDSANENFIYDIENRSEQLWKNNCDKDDYQLIKWSHDQEKSNVNFTIETSQDKQQKWALDDTNNRSIQFNLINENDQQYKHDLDTKNQISQANFIHGDDFRNQIKFAIESNDEKLNLFLNDTEDLLPTNIDSNIPSINSILSLPQNPIVYHWIEGISQYNISLPVQTYLQEYSPLTEIKLQLDSNNLKSIKWSLDLLKENLIISYLISLPESELKQYSIPDKFHLTLSMRNDNSQQLFSLIDFSFKQTLSISSDDIKNQLLTIIDSLEIRQNFGSDDRNQFYQWSLQDLKFTILNFSPIEILNLIYSPMDVKQILLENLLIESDEISARALRRYRCKHMSIKYDDKDQLDSYHGLDLKFKGNERIAIGEEHIENDFYEEQTYRDITNCKILLENENPQSYDIKTNEHFSVNLGPCLYRYDYECQPPSTWSRFRREIGYISFDASLQQPIYYLNKSFKRFLHIPNERDHCSYNVYRGHSEFLDKIRLNPTNYFRTFDSIDLRPLLYWYSKKQYLFSSINQNLLKPPTFICRRLVLRTILTNLYCDSDPWKLLVIRIKGQFYLALANRQTKSAEDITLDEYSGYKFESLFTTDQPNTTRFQEKIPLEKPQQQFHTVQYWRFGEFNLLYSNEIDADLLNNIQRKSTTTETIQENKQENETTKEAPIENSEKSIGVDWWEGEIHNSSEEIHDKAKEVQINENLRLINDENDDSIEEKLRNDNEIKAGYVEMKCTNKKIFYRDENKLQTLNWWAQMWLANVNTLMIGYKSSNDGIINQLDFLSINQLISKFLSKYDLRLKYCFSFLYSFLKLIQKTIPIDDPNTIHAFAYIPQPLDIDPLTGKSLQFDLPKCVPFRYTQMKRSNQRHSNFMPQWYIEHTQRTSPIGGVLQDNQSKTIEQETKKRIGHRGRTSCILKQEKQKKHT